jgi:hypothetical protein
MTRSTNSKYAKLTLSGFFTLGIAATLSQPAQAFGVTRGPIPTSPAPTVIDFNTPPNNTPVPGSATQIATSSTNGNATIQLLSGLAEYQGNQLNIGQSGKAKAAGTVSFVFSKAQDYFGLQWQNPTVDEVVRLYTNNVLAFTFTGLQANALGGGGNYYNFSAGVGQTFDRVDLAQVNPPNGNFFRVDDVAYRGAATTAVPTPALLPGLVGLGYGLLNKRRKAAKV